MRIITRIITPLFKQNGAKVVITDIETKNGVIHVIDAVMIPAA
ncbi:MAG: fasciclin domain-containing protein [Methanoregulaceae archaeon]|nr:fasciclin domain-containing protein [Methanoregulaceae archaeon]MCC7467996.1 fasciclin domain-containing protein [Burkholderiaceae bacterium]